MNFNARTRFQGSFSERSEVYVCGDIDEAGRREGRDEAVVADAAEGVYRDGVGGAIVDY